jgi:hypothetical protein
MNDVRWTAWQSLATASALVLALSACGDTDPALPDSDAESDSNGDGGDTGVDALPDGDDNGNEDVDPNDADDNNTDPDGDEVDSGDGGDTDSDAGDAADTADTGDTGEPTVRVPLEAIEVACEPIAPLDSGARCEVTTIGTNTSFFYEGDVLGDTTVWRGGGVLVDGSGRIECVGCDCDAGDATVVTCPGSAIAPRIYQRPRPHHLRLRLAGRLGRRALRPPQ